MKGSGWARTFWNFTITNTQPPFPRIQYKRAFCADWHPVLCTLPSRQAIYLGQRSLRAGAQRAAWYNKDIRPASLVETNAKRLCVHRVFIWNQSRAHTVKLHQSRTTSGPDVGIISALSGGWGREEEIVLTFCLDNVITVFYDLFCEMVLTF